jgi:hypothetical protein
MIHLNVKSHPGFEGNREAKSILRIMGGERRHCGRDFCLGLLVLRRILR